jgi:signal transduction histidine kinase
VIQEALANAIRHGKAKEIVVDLHETRDALILSIADDGISFDAAALPASGHHGMAVMRERIEMLGGRLVIDSANGLGTTVKAEIPRTAKPRAVPLRLIQL